MLELLARRHRLPPRAARGRPPGEHHHHRARRHHHQAQQPRAPRSTPATLDELTDALRRRAPAAPTGSCWPARCRPARPPSWYAELVAALRGAGARVAVDTSDAPAGGPGRRAARAAAPHLMKPNGEELASFTGGDADALEADPPRPPRAAARARRPRRREPCSSPWAAHGAVLVTAEGAWHATPPPTTVVSTVGAGDSSLFGYLLGRRHAARPRPNDSRSPSPTAAPPPGFPAPRSPTPTQVRTELVSGHAASTSPQEGDR